MKQLLPISTLLHIKEWDWMRQFAPIETLFCISTKGPTKEPSPMLHSYRLHGLTIVTFLPKITSLIFESKQFSIL